MATTPLKTGLIVAVIGITFFTVVGNFAEEHGWLSWYRLTVSGQKTNATITRIEPEIHQRCYYKFSIGTTNYEGWDDGCSSLGAGQIIPITYLPTSPTFSTTREPKSELLGMVLGPAFISVIAGIIAGLKMRAQQRRRH